MNYDVDYSFKTEQCGIVLIEADDPEQASLFAREYVIEEFPEAMNIEIDSVKEI